MAAYSNRIREQYEKIKSDSGKQEYRDEKRARELLNKGFNEDAVAGMMMKDKGEIRGYQKKSSCIKLDGVL